MYFEINLGDVSYAEARWAVAVVLKHARTVWPAEENRDLHIPMQIVPVEELLYANFHPDAGISITFQEERIVSDHSEHDVVLQVARRDMAKGEENFLWPGRFSNSDLLLRFNMTFQRNHIGIGDNATQLPSTLNSADDSQKTKAKRELARFNCSSVDDFELRFSVRGRPDKKLVRCWRVQWFMANGWYNPGLVKKIPTLLDKWPPPKKYDDSDLWLAMTQADNDFVNMLDTHCRWQRERLRNGIERRTLEKFKQSENEMDRRLFALRVEESQTWKNCVKHTTSVREKR